MGLELDLDWMQGVCDGDLGGVGVRAVHEGLFFRFRVDEMK